MRWICLAIALALPVFTSGHAHAQSAVDAEIAPTGKLRYGLNLGNAFLSTRGPDGSLSGFAIDLGKFIAGKLGKPFEPVAYPTTGDFTRTFGKEEWDVTLVGTSPAAKEKFYFTPDVLLVDYVYLARPGANFTSINDVDRPGIKVGASENGSASQYLKQNLKSAELVLGSGNADNQVELFRSGKIDAYGSNANNLLVVQERVPGSVLLPGAFFTVHFAIAMPKGRSPQAQERLAAVVKDLQASNLLQDAIKANGLKAIRIAP
jgi:polar amino acid transport system substrate-binding protein